jgi:hypothetical protein
MPLFDSAWYQQSYPDVTEAGFNPFLHYLQFGLTEHRSPHLLFDSKWYLNRYEDVKKSCINPLLHFCRYGWIERA